MRISLFCFFLVVSFPLWAQNSGDEELPHELSFQAGFQASLRQGKESRGGALYSIEYARFYPLRIGFRTGATYYARENDDFNIGVPLYFAYRTRIAGGKYRADEQTSLSASLLSLLPTRLEFNLGLRPGVTNIDPGGKRRSRHIENRFSCALHAGMRVSFCLGRVDLSLVPAYDYYLTSDWKYDRTVYGSFLSISGALTFRLKK